MGVVFHLKNPMLLLLKLEYRVTPVANRDQIVIDITLNLFLKRSNPGYNFSFNLLKWEGNSRQSDLR